MTKFVLLSVTSFFICSFTLKCQDFLEPQWKFYFAFEDATGARDTVWHIMDAEITSWGVEDNVQFGVVPFEIPTETFSVYMGFGQMPSTKITPSHIEGASNAYIFASNYVLPLTLSWDTALFNAPVLQETATGPICNPRLESQWFFMQTNAPWLHNQFSMIFDTQTILPEFWWGDPNQHFPITFYFDRSQNCNPMNTEAINLDATLQLYPNPCTDFLELRAGLPLQSLEVYDLHGRKLLQLSNATLQGGNDALRLDVSAIPPGMYMLHAMDAEGRKGVKKFVKGE